MPEIQFGTEDVILLFDTGGVIFLTKFLFMGCQDMGTGQTPRVSM